MKRLLMSCVALAVVCSMAGCSSTGTGPDEPTGPQYLEPTTPENILANLKTSYEAMDVDGYMTCFAEAFLFHTSPEDVSGDPTFPLFWDLATERNIHENMFAEGSGVESISLELVTTDIDTLDGPDPATRSDDIVAYTESVVVRVNVVGGLTYLATSPSVFHFRVASDRGSRDGEPVWEVCDWYDNPEGDRLAGRDEESSWGSIKAMYRSVVK